MSDGFSKGGNLTEKPEIGPLRTSPGGEKTIPFFFFFNEKEWSSLKFPNEASPGPKFDLDKECLLPSHPTLWLFLFSLFSEL